MNRSGWRPVRREILIVTGESRPGSKFHITSGPRLASKRFDFFKRLLYIGACAFYLSACPRSLTAMSVPHPRQRQIHLDFHTGPQIPSVGGAFNARAFAETYKRAHVNSVTVFAKCHHGHLYFPTKHPARHPHLKSGLDLCGEQVEALRRVGIRAPVYISVQCDEFAADTHPEWIAQYPDGSHIWAKPLEPGWQILDMSSPYLEFLEAQTEEICKRYKPVDGVFFDMCWNQPSVSNWAMEKMLDLNLDPTREEDRWRYSADLADRYMGRLIKIVRGL